MPIRTFTAYINDRGHADIFESGKSRPIGLTKRYTKLELDLDEGILVQLRYDDSGDLKTFSEKGNLHLLDSIFPIGRKAHYTTSNHSAVRELIQYIWKVMPHDQLSAHA